MTDDCNKVTAKHKAKTPGGYVPFELKKWIYKLKPMRSSLKEITFHSTKVSGLHSTAQTAVSLQNIRTLNIFNKLSRLQMKPE